MFNTVITNIPGPPVPLYMNGARLVTQFGLGPVFEGMGIIHPVFSYCGRISVAFTSDRSIMPDPENYANCLQESFEELKAAAMKKPIAAPKVEVVPVAAVADLPRPRRRKPRAARTRKSRSFRCLTTNNDDAASQPTT
jgi:hypothetical protein